MGWASAGGIFDPVAQTLIDLGADTATKRALLTVLIDKLRDGDWDTWNESLHAFRSDPATVSAFYTAVDGIDLDGCEADGWIGYDDEDHDWITRCHACGDLGHANAVLDNALWSAAEHNRLVREWAAHDREVHGGDGKVQGWVLIGGVR